MHPDFFQCVEKLRHSEPVRTLAWESRGFLNIFSNKTAHFPSIYGIAAPVCGLVRDDVLILELF